MSIKRWFDLQDQGARLDRKVGANGSGYLELSFHDAETMEKQFSEKSVEAIAAVGWVKPEAGAGIRNYGDFRDFTEIARALSVVFEDEAVTRSIVPRDALKQGEVLEGVDRPTYVGKEHIDQSLKNLPDTIRSRAMEMIEKARERQLTFRGASLGATGGRLWQLAERVSEVTSASLSGSLARIAAVRHDEDTMEQIDRLLSSETDAAKNQLDDIMSRIDIHEHGLREGRKIGIALGYDREVVEKTTAIEYIIGQPDARDLVLDLDAAQAPEAPLSEGFLREVHGYKFEVSADTTTLAAREYQARLTNAVSFIADTFGMEPSEVFMPNTRIRVVQGLAQEGYRGVHISQTRSGKGTDGEEFVDQSNAIVFSQADMGAALHEMSHGLSRRLGDDPSKYDEIIHGSGLLEAFDGTLSEGRMAGVRELDDIEYVEYLRDPEEALARLLENALRQHCIELNGNIDALGGHAISGHWQNFAPATPDVAERTLQVVRNYGAARGVMTELGVEQPENGPGQRQAASRVSMRGR